MRDATTEIEPRIIDLRKITEAENMAATKELERESAAGGDEREWTRNEEDTEKWFSGRFLCVWNLNFVECQSN